MKTVLFIRVHETVNVNDGTVFIEKKEAQFKKSWEDWYVSPVVSKGFVWTPYLARAPEKVVSGLFCCAQA